MSRKSPEINAGSMADIAFLLLLFFLVTATINTERGIVRKLPQKDNDSTKKKPVIKKRNVLLVLINGKNEVSIAGNIISVSELKFLAKNFISNPENIDSLSEGETLTEKMQESLQNGKTVEAEKYRSLIQKIGEVRISKGIISLQNDRNTEYGKYIEVQNELTAAFNELRDEFALKIFGKKLDNLDETQNEIIKEIIPLSISEAEPRNVKL